MFQYQEPVDIPALQTSKLNAYDKMSFDPVTISSLGGKFTLRPGEESDTVFAEELIREASRNGEGFALDEFKPNGQFNRAFFKNCHLAVLCDSQMAIVGIALYGLSMLVRTQIKETSHIYVIIRKANQNQGLGQQLLQEMSKVIRSMGYTKIMTDIYTENHKAMHMLSKANFVVTATIPECGYLKGYGQCNSLILVDNTNNTLFNRTSHTSKI